MARPLRITFPGAFYRVTSRGNEQKAVFKSNRDRQKYLEYLGRQLKYIIPKKAVERIEKRLTLSKVET